MAVTLANIQEGKIYACRSSLLAQFVSGSLNETIFSVSVNLKIWNGDIVNDKPANFTYQLQVPSSSMPANLFSYELDISEFVSEYVDMDAFNGTYANDSAAFVEMNWQVLTDDGSGTPSYDDTFTFAVVNGWATYEGNIEMPPFYVPSNLYMEPNSSYALTVLQRTVVGGTVQASTLDLTYSDGTTDSQSLTTTGTRTADIFQVAFIDLDYQDYVDVSIGLGPSAFSSYGDYYAYLCDEENGTGGDVDCANETFGQFFSGPFVQNKVMRIYNKCKPRYTTFKIGYQNRIGVIDYLTCYGTHSETQNAKREVFRQTVLSGNDTSNSQYKVFSANGRQDFTVNTDFIEEDANERIRDILLSKYVFIAGETNEVLIPDDNAQELIKSENNLINYTLQFKRGYDTVKSLR